MLNTIQITDIDQATDLSYILENDIHHIISLVDIEYLDRVSQFHELLPNVSKNRIVMEDTINPKDDDAPCLEEIKTIISQLNFIIGSPRKVNLLIHCLAGCCRSPAVALIAIRLNYPDLSDFGCVKELFKIKDSIAPNDLIVQLADQILKTNLQKSLYRYYKNIYSSEE